MWASLKRKGCGYTTGSCAAAAAKAAAVFLLSGEAADAVCIGLPGDIALEIDVVSSSVMEGTAVCAVRKDSGKDPDVTDGMLVVASVQKNTAGQIRVTGGQGVGLVTKPGLSVEVGQAAINPVPLSMIVAEVGKVCLERRYEGGLDVMISVPGGEELAEKTFNPRLGIVGGISILGTSGIVEPMSDKAVVETIYLELRQRAALGEKHLVVSPGNYGREYMMRSLGIDMDRAVKCGNHIGQAVDFAGELGFESVLLVGHAGKLVKVAAGIMNTHSGIADMRMEVFGLYAALCGAETALIWEIMGCVTSDEAIRTLRDYGLLARVAEEIMEKIDGHLARRAGDGMRTAAVVFTNTYGLFGKTAGADELIRRAEDYRQEIES